MSTTDGTAADQSAAVNTSSDAGSSDLVERDTARPTSPHLSASRVDDGDDNDNDAADRQERETNSWPARTAAQFLSNQIRRHSERTAAAGYGQISLPGATCRRHSSPYVDQDDQQQQQQPLRGRRRLIRPGRRPTVVVVPEVASVCSLQRLDDASPTLSRTVSLRLDECNPPPDTGFGRRPSQLAGKVRDILYGNDALDESQMTLSNRFIEHSLFVQLDVLCHFDEDDSIGWKEMARWIKYEEKVETGGRWSKPHVSTPSLHALFDLRSAIQRGTHDLELDIDLGCDLQSSSSATAAERRTASLDRVADMVSSALRRAGMLTSAQKRGLRHVLTRPHKHKDRRGRRRCRQATIVDTASLATASQQQQLDGRNGTVEQVSTLSSLHPSRRSTLTSQQLALSGRRKSIGVKRDGKEFWEAHTTYRRGVTPDSLRPYMPNKRLTRKLPADTECASLLVGHVDFLDDVVIAYFRFRSPTEVDGLTEVALPTRFLFVAVGPPEASSIVELSELGRAFATLLNDRVFCEVAYRAVSVQNIVDGIDEFLEYLIVLPPSIWDPHTRLEPPLTSRSKEKIWKRVDVAKRRAPSPDVVLEPPADDVSLRRTGRLFGGLLLDIRRRYRYYGSDIIDGLNLQCLATVVFLYFACITPIVTFGGLLGKTTDGSMGTMEMLVAGAICGLLYALFSGQPLTIVGATGPMLVFESIVFRICKENDIDFLSFRLWIGVWMALILLLAVALDLSALIRYITRFTEESFAVLISVIFIYESFVNVADIWTTYPVRTSAAEPCYCGLHAARDNRTTASDADDADDGRVERVTSVSVQPNRTRLNHSLYSVDDWAAVLPEHCVTHVGRVLVQYDCVSTSVCVERGWVAVGKACRFEALVNAVPDVFLLSCILFLGTFSVAYFLKTFRTSAYFPTQVRSVLGDFAVLVAIVLWTSVDILLALDTPKLNVPTEIKPTSASRGWLIHPLSVTYWWLAPAAVLPGVLGTILVFLDQQISTAIVNRKEHKLKKGHGYHLDLLVVSCLVCICSVLGLPWFVAATVRAITHVRSLITESDVKAPGDRPQMLGIREQRVTAVCIHLLIGLSTLLTFILQHIPMPVLYGVFLYMGVSSLHGIQFFDRTLLLLMPIKYQPDYIYLRHVQTSRVHYFTVVQITCSAVMWGVKTVKATSIAFPLMLVALMAARKAMDFMFTQRDLYWLDHLLPDESRRKKEDAKTPEPQQLEQIDEQRCTPVDDDELRCDNSSQLRESQNL